jgi:hypothetical protein
MLNNTLIDRESCEETGNLIREMSLRSSFYQRPFLTVQAQEEIRLRAFFYSVAICHQTYSLKNEEIKLYGWDYLEYVFTRLIEEQDEFLLPGRMTAANKQEITEKLATLFAPDNLPEHTTLDRLEERVLFLIDLDTFIVTHFDSQIVNLMKTANGKLYSDGNGFYEILPLTLAFSDPMKKKITFLLKLLEEAGMVEISDKENFIPIMDYHMQRVLLRMGCVEITNSMLHEKLTNHEMLDNDEEIRSACIEAFKIISAVSKHPVTKLNDFFWSLGRSCCNTEPLCLFGKCEKNPCTFYQIVDLPEHPDCAFSSACKGFSNHNYRDLWQPVVETHFY